MSGKNLSLRNTCTDYVIGDHDKLHSSAPLCEVKLLDLISRNRERGGNLQDVMRLVMNNFIVARQMGQCEALYKVSE